MRIICSIILLALLSGMLSIAHAQQSIDPRQAVKFIGREMTVCGPVVRAYYARQSEGQPTTLNLGGTFLNQYFTVLIPGEDRGKFEKSPESLYAGKQICVTGLIESYRGRPEIVVKEPSQIEVR